MFAALRHPHFRLLWSGAVCSALGVSMQMLAVGWLVVLIAQKEGQPELAALYLGFLGLARGIPGVILGLVGGVVADRFDRRLLLWFGRALGCISAAALAVVTLNGAASLAVLAVLTIADTVATSFDIPARHSMLPRIVPGDAMMSAVSLQNGTNQVLMLVGPLLAGILIASIGVSGVIALIAVIQLVALGFLVGLPSVRPPASTTPSSVLSSLIEGLRYVWSTPWARWLIGLSAIAGVTVRPLQWMYPAFAADQLHLGATELSWILAGASAGAIAGTLIAGSIGGFHRRGLLVAGSVIGWGLTNAAFAAQTSLVGALIFVLLPGIPHWILSGTTLVVIQTRTPDAFRGRVTSVMFMTVTGVSQIGVLVMGGVAMYLGISVTTILGGVIFAFVGLYVMLRVPAVRELGG